MSGYIIHKFSHPRKGESFHRGATWYTVIDWYDRATNRTFMSQYGEDKVTKGYRNMVALEKQKGISLPVDEEVVLVTSGMHGVRVFHDSQLEREEKWLQKKK